MTYSIKFKLSLASIFIALACVLAFSVVTIIPRSLFYFFFIAALVTIVISYSRWHFIDKNLLRFYGLFLFPSLIGFFSYPLSMLLEGDLLDYSQLNILGRVANLFFLSVFVLLLHSFISNNKKFLLPFRWYWVGSAVLMFTALWQFADFYLHLVSFPFDTRAHLHSAYGAEYGFSKRLTGIAEEPSYFVMFAIDFIILTLILSCGVKRLVILSVGLLLLFFSLSPSGYITFAGAFVSACLFIQVKYFSFKLKLKEFYALIALLVLVPLLLIYLFSTSYFDYFYTRIVDPRMWESARAYMSYMPFVWAWDSNPLSFLFGHGIKSYSIIGTAFNVPSGESVHATSNNFYVDTFWEAGLLGLISLITFFIFVFVRVLKSKQSKLQVFAALFILFDLIFSSMFRADFASFRYFILLYLIFLLINYDLRKVKGNESLN